MKSSRHSDHSDSSGGSSPTQLRGDSPPKTVKFVDENTIERQHRRKQIEQDNILETIISEDELEVTETRRDGKSEGRMALPLRLLLLLLLTFVAIMIGIIIEMVMGN